MDQQRRRRRVVHSCTQCYSKKQKVCAIQRRVPELQAWSEVDRRQCNRQYPCNHCVRRRKPELCSYERLEGRRSPAETRSTQHIPLTPITSPSTVSSEGRFPPRRLLDDWAVDLVSSPDPETSSNASETSLISCFGYLEGSSCNMLGLMSKVRLGSGMKPRTLEFTSIKIRRSFLKSLLTTGLSMT